MSFHLTKLMCQRNIFNKSSQLLFYNNSLINNGIRFVNIKIIKPKETIKKEDWMDRNLRLGRVQSPHLTIYKPQLTSIISIGHRITGFSLTAYALIFSWATLLSTHNFNYYLEAIEDYGVDPILIILLKVPIIFPFCYHFATGVRHLIMDMGYLLKLKEVYIAGYIFVVLAIASTIALCVL